MNWEAALSTVLVHLLGGIMTLMPLGHRPAPTMTVAPARAASLEAPPPPALALAAISGHSGEFGGFGLHWSQDPGCPVSPPVDAEAAADFPLFGEGRPFQHLPQARWSPVFCARIDRNGRILELRPAISSSGNPATDQAVARELARLRFIPACRNGQRVETWHRILVYLPGTRISHVATPSTRLGAVNGTYPVEIIRPTD